MKTVLVVIVVTLVGVLSLPAQIQGPVNLPPPTQWAAPAGAPAAPGDPYNITFTSPPVSVPSTAPIISEWNRTVMPNESFTMSGYQFTTLTGTATGADTTVWVWANDSYGGSLYQASIWKVTPSLITATLPANIPFGMYLVWVENATGASAPVCINHPDKTWIGPLGNCVVAGANKRIFGRNLSTDHGTNSSYVYVAPVGTTSFSACSTSTVNPYAVTFAAPSETGTYSVYVHSGHGGAYGWSTPVPLTVVASPWPRGSYTATVTPSGGNDTVALQNAITYTGTATTNGGTVQLETGTYTIEATVTIPDNVCLAGAGSGQTTIQLANTSTSTCVYGLEIEGNHVTISGLTLHILQQVPNSSLTFTLAPFCTEFDHYVTDLTMSDVTWYGDQYTEAQNFMVMAQRMEMSGCHSSKRPNLCGQDLWIHDSTFYGGPYGGTDTSGTLGVSPVNVPGTASEAGIWLSPSERVVMETGTFETQNWPYDASYPDPYNYLGYTQAGSYTNVPGFVNQNTLPWMTWCKRMIGLDCNYASSRDLYIANNTSTNVAVEDNKCEMVLLHRGNGCYYGQVASYYTNGAGPATVNINTSPNALGNINIEGQLPGTNIPSSMYVDANGNPYGSIDSDTNYGPLTNEAWVVVESGPGVGEKRRVLTHTSTSLTVDSPFRVPLTSSSDIALCYTYDNVVIYNNVMNAFPTGYVQDSSASDVFDFDGNVFSSAVEGNVGNNTWCASLIGGSGVCPSYWNETRTNIAYNVNYKGSGIQPWTYNNVNSTYPSALTLIGPVALGNTYHGSQDYLVGPWLKHYFQAGIGTFSNQLVPGWTSSNCNVCDGNIFENCLVTGGSRGLTEAPISQTLFRNNSTSVSSTLTIAPGSPNAPPTNNNTNAPPNCPIPEPAYYTAGGTPLYNGNSYPGSSQDYYTDSGTSTLGQVAAPLIRVAYLDAYTSTSGTLTDQITLASVGTSTVTSSVTSNSSWLTATVSNSISPESTGTLNISVVPRGLAANTPSNPCYWGFLTIQPGGTNAQPVMVGVSLVVSVYTPPTNGLLGWYAADGTLTTDNSGDVSQWNDQSGNNYNATQSTSTNQPLLVPNVLNGKPVVRFNGDRVADSKGLSTGSVTFSNATGLTIVTVGKENSPVYYGTFCAYGYDTDYFDLRVDANSNLWAAEFIPSTTAIEDYGIRECSYNTSTCAVTLYENGAQVGSGTKGDADVDYSDYTNAPLVSGRWITFGGTRYDFGGWNWGNSSLNGDLAEALIYSRQLTAQERTDMVDYLNAKYFSP